MFQGQSPPCDRNCDVLHVVEVQGRPLSSVLHRLRGKRLIMSVNKAAVEWLGS